MNDPIDPRDLKVATYGPSPDKIEVIGVPYIIPNLGLYTMPSEVGGEARPRFALLDFVAQLVASGDERADVLAQRVRGIAEEVFGDDIAPSQSLKIPTFRLLEGGRS